MNFEIRSKIRDLNSSVSDIMMYNKYKSFPEYNIDLEDHKKAIEVLNGLIEHIETNFAENQFMEDLTIKMLDAAIKKSLDKQTGGLGTTFLTNYGIEHVYPWRPSSWPVATKIYNDLSKSDVTTITVITRTVDQYFGYVAWGLVIAAWALGIYLWHLVFGKLKAIIKPFNVCPRCGHTYADKRTALGLLKVFQPWTWF
jgi:hypothetical protein